MNIEEKAADIAAHMIAEQMINSPEHMRVLRIKFFAAMDRAAAAMVSEVLKPIKAEVQGTIAARKREWEAEAHCELSKWLRDNGNTSSMKERMQSAVDNFPQKELHSVLERIIRQSVVSNLGNMVVSINVGDVLKDQKDAEHDRDWG